ncbi:AMP-binding protein [Nitrincola nitratireducens]|uniref:Long-chain-fatty-acid--CoA ligase n=1 Tax=Nitrincola nitratireducens TaxID=1229521 RepID=W9VAD1_9GAMM|nr:AMP-binding protein [Nitrincola nitratireducens]EXJ13012.1 Long-chain-fatty-acid--CoA ligase [Nitrincola nitratireducens]
MITITDQPQTQYQNLNQVIDQVVLRFSEKPAFSHLGAELSFTALDNLARRFAAWIQQHTQLQPGDRIAIQLPNSIQYPVVLFGALKAGLVVVNTNPLYTSNELENQLINSGAKALVAFTPLAKDLKRILPNTQVRWTILTELADLHAYPKRLLLNAYLRHFKLRYCTPDLSNAISLPELLQMARAEDFTPIEISSDQLALLQYTGGTTGIAKGAMLTHGNLIANLAQLNELLRHYTQQGQERLIQPLPIYHVYAFMLTLSLFSIGCRTELVPNPRDISGLIKLFKRQRPTIFSGINPLFSALLQHSHFKKVNFKALRITISGGMALTPSLAQQWEVTTGCPIAEGYGLTECSPVVSVNLPDQVQIGTAGPLLPQTQVRVVGPLGEILPRGEIGEIEVRGPQVMAGYWQQPQETAKVITRHGWLATGDIGMLNEQNVLRIVDRSKEVINVSGFKVYPTEIENIVKAMPEIEDCAAIGLPDEHTGEKIKLFVISRHPKMGGQQIRDYCKERLTSYKVPKSIEFCTTLPRSPVGKVLRRVLREQALNDAKQSMSKTQ